MERSGACYWSSTHSICLVFEEFRCNASGHDRFPPSTTPLRHSSLAPATGEAGGLRIALALSAASSSPPRRRLGAAQPQAQAPREVCRTTRGPIRRPGRSCWRCRRPCSCSTSPTCRSRRLRYVRLARAPPGSDKSETESPDVVPTVLAITLWQGPGRWSFKLGWALGVDEGAKERVTAALLRRA